jgi:hypothetical protein
MILVFRSFFMNLRASQQASEQSQPAGYQDLLVGLACGDLNLADRQALVTQILKNPNAACEAKVALRLSEQSIPMASSVVRRAASLKSTSRSFTWGFRALAGGTCAGLMMLFAMPNLQNSAPERSVAAISVAPATPDQMMSSSGFEAPDSDFGGSFE